MADKRSYRSARELELTSLLSERATECPPEAEIASVESADEDDPEPSCEVRSFKSLQKMT